MNTTETVNPTEVTDRDRKIIDSYRSAVAVHVDTMGKVPGNPNFASGVPAHAQAKALSLWWDALGLLADRVTPGDTASARFLDDQRAQWFRARDAALFACVDFCTREGLIGEPTIPRPEDPVTGILGGGVGVVGFARIGERLACYSPVDIRLQVATDGTVTLLRPDVPSTPSEPQLRRES